jgi:hypothetical protein
LPEHIVGAAGLIFTVGVVFTVTATDTAELAHPDVVPVTLYVVVTVGLAVTLAPVVALRLVEGVQAKVEAPLAVRIVELPEHIVGGGEAVIVGVVFTATRVVPAGPGHPLMEAITEYVPAAAVVAFVMDGV